MSRFLRRSLIVMSIAVVVMLASGLIFRLAGQAKLRGAKQRFEAEVGSLDLATYMLPEVPDEQNIAHWIQEGARQIEVPEDAWQNLTEFLTAPIGQWDEEDYQLATELVEANREALETLSRSAGLTESTLRFDYEKGFDAPVPDMLELLRTGRLVRLDARLAVAEGDPERLARDIGILDQQVTALGRESFLLAALIEMAADRMLMATVHDVIESGINDSDLLAGLAGRLEGRDTKAGFRRSLAGEAAVILATPALGTDAPPIGHISRIFFFLFEPYTQASMLEIHLELSRALDRPWSDSNKAWPVGAPQAPWNLHQSLIPNLLDGVSKVHERELSRRLAMEALELRERELSTGE